MVNPVVYVEARPARLSAAHQREYVYLVGRSYAAHPDLPLAQRRLDTLDQADVAELLVRHLEDGIRTARPLDDIRALAALAYALEAEAPVVALFAPPMVVAATPTIDTEQVPPALPGGLPVAPHTAATLLPTASPRLTAIATPLPSPVALPTAAQTLFRLLSREQLCPPDGEGGLIELLILDANNAPQVGLAINVSWPGGSDRFITGFKAEGYGDFAMEPERSYTVTLPDGRTRAGNLRLQSCDNGQPAAWRLTFLTE
jgi:hypothetical protein